MNKKILALVLVLSVILSCCTMFVHAEESGETTITQVEAAQASQNGIIIKYKEQNTRMLNDITILEGILSEKIDHVEIVGSAAPRSGSIELLSVETSDMAGVLKDLKNNPLVEYAEPNYTITSSGFDSDFSKQWGLNNTGQDSGVSGMDINVLDAWDTTKGDPDVAVAVIDSGIDIHHQDLKDRIYINESESSDGKDNDGNGYIDDIYGWDFTSYVSPQVPGDNSVYDGPETDRHGTHVAGIIAGSENGIGIQGVAPNIKILPVKVLSDGTGQLFTAIKGIEYAEKRGVKIANCSWSIGGISKALEDCISHSDMLFVCAAGNDNKFIANYPALNELFMDNVISVGAINNKGERMSQSNYLIGITIAAPGEDIYSTLPENQYGFLTGTSMAAPMVTGVAALIKSIAPEFTAADIKHRIKSTAAVPESLSSDFNGLLDAGAAIKGNIRDTHLYYARYGGGYVSVNGNMYAAGGYDGNQYVKKVEKYDSSQAVWRIEANLPTAAARSSVLAVGTKIYIIGGYNGAALGIVDIYDTDTKEWSKGVEMPIPAYAMGSAVVGNKIYLFGGVTDGGYTDSVFVYDTVSDQWETKVPLPFKLGYTSAASCNDSIFLVGGTTENGCIDSVYQYDPNSGQLLLKSHMSTAKRDVPVAVYQNKLSLIGGRSDFSEDGKDSLLSDGSIVKNAMISISADEYDPKTNTTSKLDDYSMASAGMGAVCSNNAIFLFGGWKSQYLDDFLLYKGLQFPSHIKASNNAVNSLLISWDKVPEAERYEVEIDGKVYQTDTTSYTMAVDTEQEHLIRVRSVKQEFYSEWSGYQRYSMNNTREDAKLIELNSITQDKLSNVNQERWYKLNTGVPGILSLRLSGLTPNDSYTMALCNYLGNEIHLAEQDETGVLKIENIGIMRYNYYVKIIATDPADALKSYTLTSSFKETSDKEAPEQIKAAVMVPPGIDNYGDIGSAESGNLDPDTIGPSYSIISQDDMHIIGDSSDSPVTYASDDSEAIGGPDKAAQDLQTVIKYAGATCREIYLNKGDKISMTLTYSGPYNDRVHKYRNCIYWRDADGFRTGWISNNPNSPDIKYHTFIAPESKLYYFGVYNYGDEKNPDITCHQLVTVTPAEYQDHHEPQIYKDMQDTNDFVKVYKVENLDTDPEKSYLDMHVTAQEFGCAAAASIDNQLDVDWYYMDIDGWTEKTFSFDSNNPALKDRLGAYLYDSGYHNLGEIEDGVTYSLEKGTYYIGVSLKSGMSYNGNIRGAYSLKEQKQTAYMVLYDSPVDRYLNSSKANYQYDEEFFRNYIRLGQDIDINFVISIRDCDFDLYPGQSDTSASVSFGELESRSKQLRYEIVTLTNNIVDKIESAYNSLGTYERPADFPKIWIGTPHFSGNNINAWPSYQQTESIRMYVDELTVGVYEDVVNYRDPAHFAGVYMGREAAFRYEDNNIWTWLPRSVSEAVHKRLGRQVLWMPFTQGSYDELTRIGSSVNYGRDYADFDLFDMVTIQPNYFYWEVSPSVSPANYKSLMENEIYRSVTSQKVEGAGGKTTMTDIGFMIEYDSSVFAGRWADTYTYPKDKVQRLAENIACYRPLIRKGYSYGIYSGGPNEQGYTSEMLNAHNTNVHSNTNFSTILRKEGDRVHFSDFYEALNTPAYRNYRSGPYTGNLIYGITKAILYQDYDSDIRDFLGGRY